MARQARTVLIAGCMAGCALAGAAVGILFQRYGGSDAVIDWTGLRHLVLAHSVRSVEGRVPVPLPAAAKGRSMVALVFGQSNAANSGETHGQPHPGVYEFYRGRLYEARDPLLGGDGEGGSVWLRLGTKAVASGQFDSVILVHVASGPAAIARWAPGGSLHGWLLSVIAGARDSGLVFTHLLWQQGEADAMAKTSAQAYREGFLAMLAAIRRMGVDAPIYAARATRCAKARPSEEIRGAQGGLIDPSLRILAGPDTDALGFAERYDGCHFSTEGLDRAAALWLEALRANLVREAGLQVE